MFHRSASRSRRQLLGEAGPLEVSACLRSTCEQQIIRILCHLDSEVPIMPASKPRSKRVFGEMRCRRDVVEQPRQGRVGGSSPQPLHPTPSMAAVNLSYVVSEHKDLQATAMALDPDGQYAVLAGRRYIALVNLDSPDITVKKSVRQSKFEVSTAEWNPHLADTFLLACNQNVELLTWCNGELLSKHTILKAHTRAISDINWSPFDENLFASSSYDTYVHIWDSRDLRKPYLSLSAVTGASQVKWNKVTQHVLATSHDGDVRIWDTRKSGSPVQYIAAHSSKIYGLDWSPASEHQLATSSQDGTVKFWDVTNPKKVEYTLQAGAPVWRARYLPFGDGLVTALVTKLRKGDKNLVIWSSLRTSMPVRTFLTHSDVVLEFGWRQLRHEPRDYQLVTWSKDQSLHLWNVDAKHQTCGQDVSEDDALSLAASMVAEVPTTPVSPEFPKSLGTTSNKGETPLPQHPPPDLEREFSLLNINIPKVIIQELDAEKRVCCVAITVGMHVLKLKLHFPQRYPYNASPTFQFLKGTTVDSNIENRLAKVLRGTSEQHVKRNRNCLEPCLRQLVATLESCVESAEVEDSDSGYLAERLKHPYAVYGSFQDSSVPFPRTSGARFCGADFLVCFTRPSHLQKMNAPTEVTPRSLSALGAYLASQHKASRPPSTSSLVSLYAPHSPGTTTAQPQDVSISSFYYKERKGKGRTQRRTARQTSSQQHPVPSAAVLIYNMSGIMPINQFLAQNYMCGPWQHLLQIRSFLKTNRGLMQQFHGHSTPLVDRCWSPSTYWKLVAEGGGISVPYESLKRNRSNSWSDSIDDIRFMDNSPDPREVERTSHRANCKLLDPCKSAQYDEFKKKYAEILYKWKLFEQRACVLKCLSASPPKVKAVDFVTVCHYCKSDVRGVQCDECKKLTLHCIVCHLAVRGQLHFCVQCGHGGHVQHLLDWFRSQSQCPSGCGCRCLAEGELFA
ncbi:GATOR2 complex protein WDR59 isoform X3 [Dermacentor andersoni]|uniref:GATOR2 complex protein WDR59 isoform X3 n=1 Tax=Dermacentor andersoni TaxID=34620 RepID=UPI00241705F8|nr:GATOR complex protein WDR59-like isoform X3 [Dermacentor andersoni]